MSTEPARLERRCRVIKGYQASSVNPISVEAGEVFTVSEKRDAWEDNPAWLWVWCTDQRGRSGWVPKNVIQPGAAGGTGTTSAAYNAIELTVAAGQELVIEGEESGWFWCRDRQGRSGWVPMSHVAALA